MSDRHKQCSVKLTTSGKNINYTGCLLLLNCAQQGGRHRCGIAINDVTHCTVRTEALRTHCIIIIFVECAELLLHLRADFGEVVEQRSNYARQLRQHQVAVFHVHVFSAGAAIVN
jgi:hypothetical protein